MADLTEEDLVYLRTQIGSGLNGSDAQDRFDRLGNTRLVVKEILEQRLADLLAQPATFNVAGEYSQSTAENIKALQQQLENLGSAGTDGFSGISTLRVVTPVASRWR